MVPCESEDNYQHYSYQWMYDTCLYVLLHKDILFIVEQPADLTLPLWGLHLQELVNLFQFYANLRDCSASHGIVKSSDLKRVVNIGTKESLGDLHRPRVQAPVFGKQCHRISTIRGALSRHWQPSQQHPPGRGYRTKSSA